MTSRVKPDAHTLRIVLVTALFLLGFTMPASAVLCGTILNPVVVLPSVLAFGFYDPLAASDDGATGTISVSCSTQLLSTLPDFTIALSAGGSNAFSVRQLSQAGIGTLNYNIYTTPSHNTVWGDGTGSTATQSYSSSLGVAATTFAAYGNVAQHQYAGPGLYTDSITVTVTY